ncbi:MAG: hypothetical protein IKD66_08010, partial [Solobacterium sp.]|nr:hypothetical protein [Solobacterium sp.]
MNEKIHEKETLRRGYNPPPAVSRKRQFPETEELPSAWTNCLFDWGSAIHLFVIPEDSCGWNACFNGQLMGNRKGAVTGDRVKNRNPVGDTAPFIFEREYLDKKLMKYKKSCEDQGIRM